MVDILTDQDLVILEFLSDDCGHPLWNLAETLTSHPLWKSSKTLVINNSLSSKSSRQLAKKLKGNLLKRLDRLETKGYIYRIPRKSTRWKTRSPGADEYPYYINKNISSIDKIQFHLADQIEGRLWYYNNIHHIEERKTGVGNEITEEHAKVHGLRGEFVHLWSWCDQVRREISEVVQENGSRVDSFCLVTPIPPCKICQDVLRRKKLHQYYQDIQRALNSQNVIHSENDLKKLANELWSISKDSEYRSF